MRQFRVPIKIIIEEIKLIMNNNAFIEYQVAFNEFY